MQFGSAAIRDISLLQSGNLIAQLIHRISQTLCPRRSSVLVIIIFLLGFGATLLTILLTACLSFIAIGIVITVSGVVRLIVIIVVFVLVVLLPILGNSTLCGNLSVLEEFRCLFDGFINGTVNVLVGGIIFDIKVIGNLSSDTLNLTTTETERLYILTRFQLLQNFLKMFVHYYYSLM